MLPTIIGALIVAVVFIAIVANEIKKKKSGKGGCSCGSNCGACPMACHSLEENKQ